VVLSADDTSDDSKELAEDLMAINTIFICRLQGRRAGQYRRLRKQQQQQQQQAQTEITLSQEAASDGHSNEVNKGEDVSKCEAEFIDETMDGLC
jgi:hypothetical protein